METTFYAFQSNVRYFLSQLLKNPIEAKPSDFLKERGFNKNKLINVLLKRNIITRHEKIDDKDETSVKYNVKYNVLRKNFEKKLKRIYTKYFEKDEIDETTTCGASSGAYVSPMGMINKKINNESIENKKQKRIFITEKQLEMLKETLTTTNAGDYTYDAPISIDKNDPSLKRKKGFSMERQK